MNIQKAVNFLKEAQHLLNPDDCNEALSVRIEFDDDAPVEVTLRDFNDEVSLRAEGVSLNEAVAKIVTMSRGELKTKFGKANDLIDQANDILSEPE